MALERIVLNIIPEGEMPVFHCSQYENGRPVIIDLVSSDDDAFLVPEGATVELHCRKVDDNIVTLEPDEVDNNTVTFVSTEQLTACPGDNLCEVVLYADTDPVQTIATLNFILQVEPDPLEGGLTSETQIYNLTQQVEEITQQVIGDDYYNKTEVDDLLDDKADKATTYTKSEVDTALNLKADKATTYTKTQVDNALALKADKATTYTKTQVDNALALKADKATTYTKTQVDNALALKADKADTYTKTQVDNALALKANTADLATVATTGDYDDLINTPSIPAAQVQSDYAQADNTQVDYIKNKPDINAMIAAALLEVMPVGTASGPIASFDTELAVPLVNVSCAIVATGGNGTPDNPNPINGYTKANITRCGMNLFDKSLLIDQVAWNLFTLKLAPNTTYTMSSNLPYSVTNELPCYVFPSSGNPSSSNLVNSGHSVSLTTLSDGIVKIQQRRVSGTDSFQNYNWQIENGNQASTYEPYNGQTYTIAFGQTVYGGMLDVTRGKLKPCIEYPSYNGETLSGRWLSSEATYIEGTTPPTGSQVVSLDDYGSDIDLTPVQINALLGVNNIYNDTNGDTEVKYKDSIQHYIDTRI